MSRKTARETLFKLVYEYTVTSTENDLSLGLLTDKFSNDDKKFISQSYGGIILNYSQLVDSISTYSIGYEKNRLHKIDLAIMLIATYEIGFMPDVPDVVSVNEAIELAKVYASDKSAGYINGILASIIKEKKNASESN